MTKIIWRLDLPDANVSTFNLEETKSWKGKLIRGHDIAEMIAEDVWKSEAMPVQKLHILEPRPYAGVYEIAHVLEPIFFAKKVDCSPKK